MFYGEIKKFDIADGEGVRVSVFVSGCKNACKGCFQPQTWDFSYGKEFGLDALNEVLEALDKPFIQGLSILGGDPMEPENQAALLPFLYRFRTVFPDKDIWLYTGYDYETLTDSPLLPLIDVIVDGKYSEEERDVSLAFRGSRNQRIIDVPASLQAGRCILWNNTEAAQQQEE